jgi:ribosomal protein L7/L12
MVKQLKSFRLSKVAFDIISKFTEKFGISQAAIVELALRALEEKHKNEK